MNIHAQRIQALREAMKQHSIDAYLILTSDPHLSEYLPEFWKTREYLSGFSGSAGSLLITQEYAALWADGRYWLQAEKELQGTGIELQKQDSNNTYISWILNHLNAQQTLATHAQVLPLFLERDLNTQLEKKGIRFIADTKDLISPLWQDRPPLPKSAIYPHFSSPLSCQEKLGMVRQEMQACNASYHFISSLDDVAWITNLRGSDVSYNPVFLAHFLLSDTEAILFVDESKVSSDVASILAKDHITLKPYHETQAILSQLKNEKILIDSSKMTAYFASILDTHNTLIDQPNPSTMFKSCKNDAELAHIRQAMEQDGIALCHFFVWLEEALKNQQRINECDIDTKLTEIRSKQPNYISDSFATIAGFNGNGAQPHYRATPTDCATIQGNGFLLIDSGAQYTNGTTDITRVVPIGNITSDQKRDYTLVLKAHIAMTSTIFPEGIPMPLLDSITRAPLWREQLDYAHGTGHGVGYFLNVHEGPQVISYYAPVLPKTKAKAGMITSIEPGLYRANQWGVRLENLVANRVVQNPKENGFGKFLYFEPLTLCPFETSCIDTSLLDQREKDWINSYHQEVYRRLKDKLEGKALEWLTRKTQAL